MGCCEASEGEADEERELHDEVKILSGMYVCLLYERWGAQPGPAGLRTAVKLYW